MINEDLLDLVHEVGRFNVVVADMPWPFDQKKTGGSFKSGSVQYYPTMAYEEIERIPMQRILQKNAVLFAWVPVALSYEIARSNIFEAWDLKFKTKLFWEKEGKLGLGFWYRNQIEECWIFKRGSVKPFRSSEKNIIHVKPRKHSQKPDEMFDLIEKEVDKAGIYERLELFARGKPRAGWAAMGNEVDRD